MNDKPIRGLPDAYKRPAYHIISQDAGYAFGYAKIMRSGELFIRALPNAYDRTTGTLSGAYKYCVVFK
jgi:hypothetical protein